MQRYVRGRNATGTPRRSLLLQGKPVSDDTRAELLQTARHLFAAKGYYGASLANIADELGLTKQALLHHFGSKDKLYGKILLDVSERMLDLVETAKRQHAVAADQLESVIVTLYLAAEADPSDSQIIMRELLDSERRLKDIRSWYLKPFLDALIEITREIAGRRNLDSSTALTVVYSLLGSLNYFVVSGIVLNQMYGDKVFTRVRRGFPDRLRQQVQDAVSRLRSS